MSRDEVRDGILRLASITGWSEASILAMPTSRFLWYLAGLKSDG